MKLWNTMKRLVSDDDGMEMVEWAIVGVVFAVAAAAFWSDLATEIRGRLDLYARRRPYVERGPSVERP